MPTALWVLPVADLGGVARHALDVARVGLPGWRTVVTLPPGPLVPLLRAAGAKVRPAPIGPAHGVRRSVGALREVIAEVRPDLVHTHLSYADVVGAVATPRATTLVTTEHGVAADDLVYHRTRARARVKALAHRARFARTDGLIAVSRATLAAAEAKWHVPARVRRAVVPNGVDRFAPPARGAGGLHVVSLARFAPEKRYPELVEAFARLHVERPEARLTLAGDGPLREEVRSLVARRGLQDLVDLPGHVDAGELLDRADVLALLSVWENCSYALLDAVARGVGVVASDVGGNPEILPAHCLVDPSRPADVAARLAEQADQPALRPDLADDWPDVATMAARTAAFYEEVGR
ncbi:glycosyltransferase [Alteromonas gracilis]